MCSTRQRPIFWSTGDYPLAWAHSFGAGRVYYNALGHFSETWTGQRFQRQLAGGRRVGHRAVTTTART